MNLTGQSADHLRLVGEETTLRFFDFFEQDIDTITIHNTAPRAALDLRVNMSAPGSHGVSRSDGYNAAQAIEYLGNQVAAAPLSDLAREGTQKLMTPLEQHRRGSPFALLLMQG